MPHLYDDLGLAAQTSFASVNQAAQQADLRRSVADVPGGFAKKQVAGRTYWYHQVRNPNGSLIQTYVGPDDESTRLLIARHGDPKAKAARKHLVSLARAAIELGCTPIPPNHARVIERLAECGLFSAGGILVGTHAFLAYQNHFGVSWSVGHATLDLDFAHAGANVSLALPENLELDAAGAIESLEMGFVPNQARTTFTKEDEPDFDLDFLTSCGRGGDEPVELARFNLTMQPLKFMELSLEDPMRATLLWRNGPIVVNLPRPQRYALHKLIVYGERPQAQRAKANKDLAQAAALLDYLLDHDSDSTAEIWADVSERGPGWRKRLNKGFRALTAKYPDCNFKKRLQHANGALEEEHSGGG
ncbi:MAG: nucleotidyltransferase domain-containing protein [Ramlibacter sp.]|nr:nucleotidyltransferase domain-containing protein [Ramlibacter sp.]